MKKILIAEDDAKVAVALAARLEAAGYDVLTANDGFEGIKQAIQCKPDLVLMDIWMPVGLGFSVAQRLQELGLGDIPIIFITASKLEGLRKTAEELGAAGFIEKPYKPEELLSTIADALRRDGRCRGGSACTRVFEQAPDCHSPFRRYLAASLPLPFAGLRPDLPLGPAADGQARMAGAIKQDGLAIS